MKERLQKVHFGIVLGVLVAVYIGFYLAQTIIYNYKLQGQISDLQQQLDNLQTDKQALQYKIQYYQTDAYKEKEARAKLGLQAPGEGVVILPHSDDKVQSTTKKVDAAPKKSSWKQWMDFLAGRG